jgi:hypothetical protein
MCISTGDGFAKKKRTFAQTIAQKLMRGEEKQVFG